MHPARQSNRGFGLTFAAVFAIIAVFLWWFADRIATWAIVLASLFLFFALAIPHFLMPLNRLWMAFVTRFSLLSNGLLLGLIFYVVFLPTALVLRAVGTDPMDRRRDRAAASYWRTVGRTTTRETMRDLF